MMQNNYWIHIYLHNYIHLLTFVCIGLSFFVYNAIISVVIAVFHTWIFDRYLYYARKLIHSLCVSRCFFVVVDVPLIILISKTACFHHHCCSLFKRDCKYDYCLDTNNFFSRIKYVFLCYWKQTKKISELKAYWNKLFKEKSIKKWKIWCNSKSYKQKEKKNMYQLWVRLSFWIHVDWTSNCFSIARKWIIM